MAGLVLTGSVLWSGAAPAVGSTVQLSEDMGVLLYRLSVEVLGGRGDDELMGGPADDLFAGGSGDDVMFGGEEEDVFDEGRVRSGNDEMNGGFDPDASPLSPVRDRVDYSARTPSRSTPRTTG